MKKMLVIPAALLLGFTFSTSIVVFASSPHSQTLHELGQAWLDAHQDPALVNVSGDWESEFGEIHLEQAEKARDVKGMGPGYEIRGVVSGTSIYLLFLTAGDYVDYCAVLSQENGRNFYGTYSNRAARHDHHDLCETQSRPMSLRKLGVPSDK